MSNEKHLESVTVENLVSFRSDSFTTYASSNGVKLGYNGLGNYVVRLKEYKYVFNNPEVAIDMYKTLISQEVKK
jgi:hypothetical protein